MSDHFDGKRFFTPGAPPERGFGSVLRWMLTRTPSRWTLQPFLQFPKPLAAGNDEQLRVTFINHSTVLLQLKGLNILTDPIWSERASPVSFAGPKRFSHPGVALDDLPPIDVVLLSHNHYDHMDLRTLSYLERRHAPKVYVPLGNRRYLKPAGMDQVAELDWWDSATHKDRLTIHCTPSQHFSGRGLFDRNRSLWCSWVIESGPTRIYFGGDTGFGPHFKDIAKRFRHFRLALLPIGAYEPRWFMSPVHVAPEEAVEAHKILDADLSVGIHFGTFQLTDEPQFEPEQRIRQLAEQENINFRVLRNGQALEIPLAVQSAEHIG